MSWKSGFVVVIALAASLTTLAPADAVPAGITGTVTGPGGNLAGIPVTAYSPITEDPNDQTVLATTTTGLDGTYLLPVTNVDAIVCFESPNFAQECWDGDYRSPNDDGRYGGLVVSGPTGIGSINASLIIGSSITGTLSTELGDAGGVLVTATLPAAGGVYSTVSESDGSYLLAHLPPGTYTVCASSSKLIKQCTGDVGGPTAYAVDEDDVIQEADIDFVSRPQNLRVVSNGYDRFRVAWDAVPGATTYQVIWSQTSTFGKVSSRTVTGTTAKIAGLYFLYGTHFWVTVRAQGGTATTARSAIVEVDTFRVTGLRAVDETFTAITWAWRPFEPAAKYQLQLSSVSSFAGYRSVKTTSLQAAFANLTGDKTYYARVRPLKNDGTPIAGWSKVATGRTGDGS